VVILKIVSLVPQYRLGVWHHQSPASLGLIWSRDRTPAARSVLSRRRGIMPGMVIAATCLVLVLAAAYWHDRRNRDRAGATHDMEQAARMARGETDRNLGRHVSPPAGPPPPGPSL
jgi:hypothetical protein